MLYIKVIDGKTVDHPVMYSNLIAVFGVVPPEYEPFKRLNPPVLGNFEVFDTEAVQYAKEGEFWVDLWPKRAMTAEELAPLHAQINNYVETYRADAIAQAQTALAATTDETEKQMWERYIHAITSYQMVDFNTSDMPVLPKRLENGRWFKGNSYNLNAAGSAPNVIS